MMTRNQFNAHAAASGARTRRTERDFMLVDIDQLVVVPSKVSYAFFFSFGIGAGLTWFAIDTGASWVMPLALALTAGGAGALYTQYRQLDRFTFGRLVDETHEPDDVPDDVPETTSAALVTIELENGFPAVDVWEPHAGAFARWLSDVLRDNDRYIRFSQNQGTDRGWPRHRYAEMVQRLQAVRLVTAERDRRGTYALVESNKAHAREWLRREGFENG